MYCLTEIEIYKSMRAMCVCCIHRYSQIKCHSLVTVDMGDSIELSHSIESLHAKIHSVERKKKQNNDFLPSICYCCNLLVSFNKITTKTTIAHRLSIVSGFFSTVLIIFVAIEIHLNGNQTLGHQATVTKANNIKS